MVILRTSYAKGMETKSGKAGECVLSNARSCGFEQCVHLGHRFWGLEEELTTMLKGETRTSGGMNAVVRHQEWVESWSTHHPDS